MQRAGEVNMGAAAMGLGLAHAADKMHDARDAELAKLKASTKSLAAKLAEVMKEVGRVAKRGKNAAQGYAYATEADVADEVRGHLADRGILFVPSVDSLAWRSIQGKHGEIAVATVQMTFRFFDGTDEIAFKMVGEGMDSGDKNVYKAITGAEKYALMKFFLIPTGDDPEKDEKPESKPESKPKAEPTQKPGCLAPDQTDALWKYARKLFPKDARERLKALLEKHGVERTADLPVYPAGNDDASGWGGYANELDVMLSEAK